MDCKYELQGSILNNYLEKTTKQIRSLNTIAALAYQINYYISGMLNVFEAGALEIRDKHSFDLPEIKSKKDWNQLFNEILTNAEKFVKHVENMTSDQLENIFVHEKYGTFLP